MKKAFLQCMFIFLILTPKTLSQCIYYDDLDSPDWGVRFEVLKQIAEEGLVDCLDDIHDKIFEQPHLTLSFAFLETLDKLEDPEIVEWTLQFIEEADNLQPDPLTFKVQATKILFGKQNYSTVHYIFDLLERDLNQVNVTALVLLNEIILNVPQYSQNAISELVRILNNYQIEDKIRLRALNYLKERNYNNIINQSLNVVTNDPSFSLRHFANEILHEMDYPGLHDLYLQQLTADDEALMRSKYATSLLHIYSEPFDLKTVLEYHPLETDTNVYWLVGYEIDNFIPQKPDTLNWNELTTGLISYTDEMYGYGWIANEETRDHYLRYLTAIIESITETGSTVSACSMLQMEILERLEEDLSMELVTIEGYKFLHYYAVYIKAEIEENYGACLYKN